MREQIKKLPDLKYLFVSTLDTTDIQDEYYYDLDTTLCDDQGQDMENEPREERRQRGQQEADIEGQYHDIWRKTIKKVASTKQMKKKEFIRNCRQS